jgi:hypothetical protein
MPDVPLGLSACAPFLLPYKVPSRQDSIHYNYLIKKILVLRTTTVIFQASQFYRIMCIPFYQKGIVNK